MEIIGQVVIAIMMIFLIIGAIASIFNDETGFGREPKEGIHSIGPIFLTVAGIMSQIPILLRQRNAPVRRQRLNRNLTWAVFIRVSPIPSCQTTLRAGESGRRSKEIV